MQGGVVSAVRPFLQFQIWEQLVRLGAPGTNRLGTPEEGRRAAQVWWFVTFVKYSGSSLRISLWRDARQPVR